MQLVRATCTDQMSMPTARVSKELADFRGARIIHVQAHLFHVRGTHRCSSMSYFSLG